MAVKYIDTYSKKLPVAVAGTVTIFYCLFALPFHIPIALYAIYNFQELIHSRFTQDRILTVLLILSFILVILIINYSIYRQRKNIKEFTSVFSELGLNKPQSYNIAKNLTGWSYLALDTKNGTILYINHPDTTVLNFFFPKDVRVMGFGMYDWKSIEIEDNKKLTIYTGDPDLPSISVESSKAGQLYEKINAMRNQHWSYEFNIPGYVKYHAEEIADKNGINLILPPK